LSRVVLLALAVVAYHGLVLWDPRSHGYTPLEGWLFEASETTPQIVFAIAAGLLLRRRERLRRAVEEPSPRHAALFLLPGFALHLWSQWVAAPELLVPSLWLVAVGASLLVAGRRFAREIALCLAVLFFAVPLPGPLHNHLVYPFQLATAHGAEWALQTIGYTAARQGDTLWIGAREFEVIETCSGLRAVQTLTFLACAWALFFACRARHAALLIASAPLLAYAANVVRVMVLVVDSRPEVREAHTVQGIVMFVAGSIGLFLVDHLLLRFLPGSRPADDPARERTADPTRGGARRSRLALSLALGVMTAAALAGARRAPPTAQPPPTLELPRELAGWKVAEGPEHGQFLGSIRFVQLSSRTYERDGGSVWAFLAWDDRGMRSRSLLSRKHALPGLGWDVEERRTFALEPDGPSVPAVVARQFQRRALVVHLYRGAGSLLGETLRATLALDQVASPFARRDGVSLLRLSTDVSPGPEGVREAESVLRSLFADLSRALDGQRWSRTSDVSRAPTDLNSVGSARTARR
jgi:exosortase